MPCSELGLELRRLPTPVPIWHGRVHQDAWSAAARSIADTGGRLVSVWGVDRSASGEMMTVCAAYAIPEGLVWLELRLEDATQRFPDLADAFPCAERMQRAVADLSGIRAEGHRDDRPWLDHRVWSAGPPPLQPTALSQRAAGGALPADYPFVRVDGDGVHEIAVGPVHAGIIEPGHFRFSVVGEKVLRLEQHLGYTHKGIERRFTELMPLEGHRLAGRISGDTTVAYAWAYCMALESAWGCEIPERASWLRALMLERERVANHLGDLGALANDAALTFGLAQFSRLREDWLRLSREIFGHRLMMDAVMPGGVAVDLTPTMQERLRSQCDAVEQEVRALGRVYDEHAGLQDRFVGAGRVTPQLAAQLGLTGLAGRASGQAADLRCDFPCSPYDRLEVVIATHQDGDVAARVAVRFDEVFESLRLIRVICTGMPGGAAQIEVQPRTSASLGAGWVEGWRGEVFVALEIGGNGRIVRCHCHDPSWQNWPVLEHAIIGNIVPDFPLINKSFNLSYSGHDL
ncbi:MULTISPECIES: NADH-quinone oxidoreductase subunit C [unclassified Variovorax]|uniref:hydrogenase large subunit n=1 Tax=unclassified Variovorax TaxID=663243 RepID=UPI003F45C3B8